MSRRRHLPIAVLTAVLATIPVQAGWTHLRGPAGDGRLLGSGLFAGDRALELAWSVPIGSGYSGIVGAGGRGVTMFAEGESDVMVAFDLDSGRRIWSVSLGPMYKGHDGSDDGPLSSPVIAGDLVYGLGPTGRLVAVRLADGTSVWSVSLPDAFGAKMPDFGFTTTPVVAGDVLVVLTGGPEGRAISGLDRHTGETRWSVGDGAIEYQSPTPMKLGGRDQVVAVAGTRLFGLDPVDGRTLWSHQFSDDVWTSSSTPTSAGEDRVLIFAGGEMHVFTVTADEGDFTVDEAYRSKELGSTYALPVYHDGHLYGFKRQFLTCVDAASGTRVWKSRPPGGRGLLLVDDQLVVFGAEGNVVVARATPDGYEERTRVKALEGSGYTWPSVAGGRILVRNLDSMAAVVPGAPKAAVGAADPGATLPRDGAVGSLVTRAEELSRERRALIDSFLERHDGSPIIEGGRAHFVYRGDAEDVALEGTMIASGQAQPMARVADTDLYIASLPVESGSRHEYRFVVDFDNRVTDPRNPKTVPGRWGDSQMSELVMPGYRSPTHLGVPSGAQGTVETVSFGDEAIGEREIQVWLPPGYETRSKRTRYPLLIVHGTDYLDKGLMSNALGNLTGSRVRPLIAVFVPAHDEWWTEAGGARTDAWVDALAQQLVPMLESRYPLQGDAASRAVMGFEGFGLTAAYAAAKHPSVFGKAAAQSPMITLGLEDAFMERLPETRGKKLQFYVDWNRYGGKNVDSAFDLAEQGARLWAAIERSGHELVGGERRDAQGWGSRRAASEQILVSLFPAR